MPISEVRVGMTLRVELPMSAKSVEMAGLPDIALENPGKAAHLGRARKMGRVKVKE